MLSSWARFERTFGDLGLAYDTFEKAESVFHRLAKDTTLSYRDVCILCYACQSLSQVYPYTDVRASELLHLEIDLISRTFGAQHVRLIPIIQQLMSYQSLLHRHYTATTMSRLAHAKDTIARHSLSPEQRSLLIGQPVVLTEESQADRIVNGWKQRLSVTDP